ncbi:MAG: type II toxin-antitoxin system RelE/ParE family toxin [Hyphomicrobiales bacterium]
MKIRFRRVALSDIESIHSYISEQDPSAAARVCGRIFESIARLAEFPLLGRTGVVESTYELVVPKFGYIVVYRITERVEIVGVFHPSEDRTPEQQRRADE